MTQNNPTNMPSHRICNECGTQSWGSVGKRCPGPDCDGSCPGTIVLVRSEEISHVLARIEPPPDPFARDAADIADVIQIARDAGDKTTGFAPAGPSDDPERQLVPLDHTTLNITRCVVCEVPGERYDDGKCYCDYHAGQHHERARIERIIEDSKAIARIEGTTYVRKASLLAAIRGGNDA